LQLAAIFDDKLFISPNPATDFIKIQLPKEANGNFQLSIFSIDRKLQQRMNVKVENYKSIDFEIS